jgi:hypothetical protein
MRRRKILNESELDILFSQIEVICEITEILKDKIEERLQLWPAVQKFGDIFKDTSPLMKLYYRYIFNFQEMQARIEQLQHQNSEFREFLEVRFDSRVAMQTITWINFLCFLVAFPSTCIEGSSDRERPAAFVVLDHAGAAPAAIRAAIEGVAQADR